jgi:hypothetical protein
MNIKPQFLKDLVQHFQELDQNDPVKHCRVYKTIGCAHVDGLHCDMRTCEIEVTVKVSPKRRVEV